MRSEQQLRTFLRVLDNYPADRPLSKFLPDFYRKNKQMGSNDRKSASRLLYNYFRLGRALREHPAEERLFVAEFLCNDVDNPFLDHFRPAWNRQIGLPLRDKLDVLTSGYGLDTHQIFPFLEHCSADINKEAFSVSHLVQPNLYIRVQGDQRDTVLEQFSRFAVPYELIGSDSVSLPNGTDLAKIFPDGDFPVKPYQVQDISSQRTREFFQPERYEHWWDACAASGGKSLLLFAEEPHIKLVVSDIRESVLDNLDERFIQAGLRTYQKKALDLTLNQDQVLSHYHFDGIILDAPCSGSGTWGRTPEMISQFREHRISDFNRLQRTIASNVIPYLRSGKPLIYITCSVFREENEAVVDYLVAEKGMQLERMAMLKGYENRADTMFAARLIKP